MWHSGIVASGKSYARRTAAMRDRSRAARITPRATALRKLRPQEGVALLDLRLVSWFVGGWAGHFTELVIRASTKREPVIGVMYGFRTRCEPELVQGAGKAICRHDRR